MKQSKIESAKSSKHKVGKEIGLLSDLEILERLVAEEPYLVFVSPLIDPTTQLGPSSLDLRLGLDLVTTRVIASTHIDLTAGKQKLNEQKSRYMRKVRLRPNDDFVLHPGEFVLASTLEFIRLPMDIAGRLEGRSSLGRLGLQVHATAGFVDPGFEGSLTFELINSGKLPVKIFPGIRLGQLCLFKIKDVQVPYTKKSHSKYARLGVELTHIENDPEIAGGSKYSVDVLTSDKALCWQLFANREAFQGSIILGKGVVLKYLGSQKGEEPESPARISFVLETKGKIPHSELARIITDGLKGFVVDELIIENTIVEIREEYIATVLEELG